MTISRAHPTPKRSPMLLITGRPCLWSFSWSGSFLSSQVLRGSSSAQALKKVSRASVLLMREPENWFQMRSERDFGLKIASPALSRIEVWIQPTRPGNPARALRKLWWVDGEHSLSLLFYRAEPGFSSVREVGAYSCLNLFLNTEFDMIWVETCYSIKTEQLILSLMYYPA